MAGHQNTVAAQSPGWIEQAQQMAEKYGLTSMDEIPEGS